MAIAGKVAPTFKGDYDATVTYQFYDVVRHNNSLWMSKKSNTLGIEPTAENAEYWFLAIDGSFTDASTLDGHDSEYFATAQSVTDIEDGTTPAGNALQLGGKGASEYALDTDLANYLPLSGGTISKADTVPLIIRNTVTKPSLIRYDSIASTPCGYLGFYDRDNPIFMQADSVTVRQLLHTGNKPTGTYTGNGSATSRTISTGGIGSAIYVEETYGTCFALVLNGGAIVVDRYNNSISVVLEAEYSPINGNIKLFTEHDGLNKSGSTYRYYTL